MRSGRFLSASIFKPDSGRQLVVPRHHLVAALAQPQHGRLGEEAGGEVLHDGLGDDRAGAGREVAGFLVRERDQHPGRGSGRA